MPIWSNREEPNRLANPKKATPDRNGVAFFILAAVDASYIVDFLLGLVNRKVIIHATV
jgi:hypothetical protein